MSTAAKPPARPRATQAARARAEDGAQRLDRVFASLEAAQTDLASIGRSVGTGTGDLRRDLSRLLRDARRDVNKMRRAVQRDVERLQKDLTQNPTTKTATSHARHRGQRPEQTLRRG